LICSGVFIFIALTRFDYYSPNTKHMPPIQTRAISLDEDIYKYLESWYTHWELPVPKRSILKDDLINLFTIQVKYIHQLKREVFISKELEEFLQTNKKLIPEVNHLRLLFLNGRNVNEHQSSELFNHHVPDGLVFDWKIYHLHLSTQKSSDPKFNDRTDELLFVYVDDTKALFLGIANHKPFEIFANKTWLEIIDSNWDNVLTYANGVFGLSHNLNEKERLTVRKVGVNEGIVEVNGKFVFSPNLGVVSSGHSSAAVGKMLGLMRFVNQNLDEINLDQDAANSYFKKAHGLVKDVSYKLSFDPAPKIIDGNTNKVLIQWGQKYSMLGAKAATP
jgi:hypothetical protein